MRVGRNQRISSRLVVSFGLLCLLSAASCSRCDFWSQPENPVNLVYDVGSEGQPDEALLEGCQEVVAKRLESIGGRHASVKIAGKQLLVTVEYENALDVKASLRNQGVLQFRVVDDEEREFYEKLRPMVDQNPNIQLEPDSKTYQLKASDVREVDGTRSGEVFLTEFMKGVAKAGITPPPNREILFERRTLHGAPTTGQWRSYLVHRAVLMTGETIDEATVAFESAGPEAGLPYVTITLDDRGRELFGEITGANLAKRLAIVIDGQINSAPVIQERITGGVLRISMGSFGHRDELYAEAHELAASLSAGALPAPLVLLSEETVGTEE